MSYYPTERRGGCMESLARCCRQAYVYPLDTRKLLYAGGAVVGIILIAVIWSGLSSSESSAYVQPFKGSKVLHEAPLIVGSNFFPVNLKNLVQNDISKVSFDKNLSNDTVFGNAVCKSCQTDIPRLQKGLVGSQIWSLRVPCSSEYKDAVALTLEQLDAISRLLATYPNNITFLRSSKEVMEEFQRGNQVGSLLSVTSGHSFDGRMSVLRTLYNLGVRVMALTSSCSTAWAASFNEESTTSNDTGLTEFGVAVVKEMNRLGMLIDLSEASHMTQRHVLNVTKAPVVFTRGAAYGVCNNPRNIQDEVLQKVVENGGLVMVTFAAQYLTNNVANVSTADVLKHIEYIKNKTGVDHVGIGAEYDAEKVTYPPLLSDVTKFPQLFDDLGDQKWSEDNLKKIAGENFLRVLQRVEQVAKESSSLTVDESFVLQTNSSCYSDYDERLNAANSSLPLPTNTPIPTKATTGTSTSETTKQVTTLSTTILQTNNTSEPPKLTTAAKPTDPISTTTKQSN